MYEFFDKHGKKFLAVVGSILMIAFIMPSGMGSGNRGGGRQYGTIDGKAVSASDVDAAHSNLEAAERLRIPGEPEMQGMPAQPVSLLQRAFPDRYFGHAAQSVQQNPQLWYLLVREAMQNGPAIDEATIDQILASPNITLPDPSGDVSFKDMNPTVRETFRPAIRELLAVSSYVGRRQAMMKVTNPMIDDALARQTEQVRVRLATFKASDFEKDIAAPTAEQLQDQFNSYAAEPAGPGTNTNPFGFGYKIPDKLQLQWIAVPRVEVQHVVDASKSPELWEEDAIMYYQQHPEDFQSPATQPTTRPYADAKSDVLSKLRDPQVDQLQQKIAVRIVQQMTYDAQRARAAGPTTQQAAAASTAYGAAYGSFDYLQKLAADIEKQFGVKVEPVNQALPLSISELQAIGGIGQSRLEDTSSAQAIGASTGPAYLFGLCKPLLSGNAVNQLGVYDLLTPSKILKTQNVLFVARALSAEGSHAPNTLDEVRPLVEKDVREKLAFAKAADAAQKLVAGAAAAGSFDKVGASVPVQTSDWFGAQNSSIEGIKDLDDAFDLITPVFDILRGVQSPGELPRRTVIKRQAKGTVVAAELFDLRTTLSTTGAAEMRFMAMRGALQSMLPPPVQAAFITDWFSMDGVSRRIGFVPDATNQPKPGQAAPPAGNNPFLPG